MDNDYEPDREWSNEDLDQDSAAEKEARRLEPYDGDIDGDNSGDFEVNDSYEDEAGEKDEN